jgi:hypothetical protein
MKAGRAPHWGQEQGGHAQVAAGSFAAGSSVRSLTGVTCPVAGFMR